VLAEAGAILRPSQGVDSRRTTESMLAEAGSPQEWAKMRAGRSPQHPRPSTTVPARPRVLDTERGEFVTGVSLQLTGLATGWLVGAERFFEGAVRRGFPNPSL